MFGLLKNKLASFIGGLSGREEKKAEDSPSPAQQMKKAAEKPEEAHVPAGKVEKAVSAPPGKTGEKKHAAPEKKEAPPAKKSIFDAVAGAFSAKPAHATIPAAEAAPKKPAEMAAQEKPAAKLAEPAKAAPAPKATEKPMPEKQVAKPAEPAQQAIEKPSPTQPKQKNIPKKEPEHIVPQQPSQQPLPDLSRLEKKAQSEKRDMAPKIGFGTAIKSFFSNEITIGEGEVADLLEELELSLLEADVAYDVSSEVTSQLRSQLVGMKVPKGQVEKKTKETIQNILESVMESDRKFDFVGRIKGLGKPAKILFVGPNGAGKTTTMAKVARMLMDAGLSAVFSASDTFRAAAIEQTEVHGGRLGVKTIKSKYGADPASVAFDAINYARASKVDVVLIDAAGRQDTNANLLSELVKINRVAQPDLKIYVGESIGGNSVIDQIKAFNTAIGIDGAILTKIDCDAKGGTAISIAKSTGIPVLFLGIGQGYSDLVPFDAHKIAQEIMN